MWPFESLNALCYNVRQSCYAHLSARKVSLNQGTVISDGEDVVNLQGNWGLSKGVGEGRKGHPGQMQGAQGALQQPHSTSSAECHGSCFINEVQKLIDNFLGLFFFSLLTWIQAFYDYMAPTTWS